MKLGDTHNFGHFVSRSNNWMIKPREIYWEELFLSSSSKFRGFLNQIFKEERFSFRAMDIFPQLKVKKNDKNFPFYPSKISLLKQEEIQLEDFTELNFKKIGTSLGIMAYFGMADLHRENIILAKNSNQGFIFGPIDIECLFNDFSLLSQTRLLPTHDLSIVDCGLNSLDFFIREYHLYNQLGILIEYYSKTILALKKNEHRIFNHPSIQSSINKKLRVILSSTRKYYEYLSTKENNHNFLSEELKQLERDEIPYFFRFADQIDKINYYVNQLGDFEEITVKNNKDEVLKLAINFNKIPFKIHDEELIVNGSLQLLKFFLREIENFSYHSQYLSINQNNYKLTLDFVHNKKYSCLPYGRRQ